MKRRNLACAAMAVVLLAAFPLSAVALESAEIRQPDGDPDAFWDALDWEELSAAEQALWMILGWDAEAWDGDAEAPDSESHDWRELSLQEQAAARLLGYSTSSWDGEETADLLFIQSASSGSLKDGLLTLEGALHTVFFSERPGRIVGEMTNVQFLAFWEDAGGDSFEADPPNAALEIGVTGETVILELIGPPEISGTQVAYPVRILQGEDDLAFGTAALFIDSIPTPVNGQITDSVTQAFAKPIDDATQPTTVNGAITD